MTTTIIVALVSLIVGAIVTFIICYLIPKEKVRSANQELDAQEQQVRLRIKDLEREYAEKDKELDSEFYQKLNTLQTQNNELWVKQQELVQQIEQEKTDWEREKNEKNLQLIQETQKLEVEVQTLETKRAGIIQTLEREARESGEIFKAQQLQIATEQLEAAKQEMQQNYTEATGHARDTYLEVLADLMADIGEKYEVSAKELEEAMIKLADIRQKTEAAIEVNRRAELERSKKDFYRLQLSEPDLEEIQRLRSVAPYLRDKEPLNKVIYKCYYEKPYTNLIGRVFNGKKPSGIYKITNLLDGKCYIGQSSNVPERWRQHIKRGVGAEAPTQNKLYPAMLEQGVENFMFELVEECPIAELTKKEKFWTDFYGAQTYGYVVKKG